MAGKLTFAALLLAMSLAAAGCGSTAAGDAGASASRWAGSGDGNAIQYQNEARGPLSDGSYSADAEGRVDGFDRTQAQTRAGEAGREMQQAGKNLMRGAKDAAKNAADMAEDAMDDVANAARSDRARAEHIADPQRN